MRKDDKLSNTSSLTKPLIDVFIVSEKTQLNLKWDKCSSESELDRFTRNWPEDGETRRHKHEATSPKA